MLVCNGLNASDCAQVLTLLLTGKMATGECHKAQHMSIISIF